MNLAGSVEIASRFKLEFATFAMTFTDARPNFIAPLSPSRFERGFNSCHLISIQIAVIRCRPHLESYRSPTAGAATRAGLSRSSGRTLSGPRMVIDQHLIRGSSFARSRRTIYRSGRCNKQPSALLRPPAYR